MFNLVGNAIKFTQEGGITIAVDVLDKEVVFHDRELSGMVQIQVIDTGIGVSPKIKPVCFNHSVRQTVGLAEQV